MKKNRGTWAKYFVGFFCLSLGLSAVAQTTFTNLAGGAWSDAANWDNGVPIPATPFVEVSSGGTVHVSTAQSAGTGLFAVKNISQLQIAAGGSLTQTDVVGMDIKGASTVANSGSLTTASIRMQESSTLTSSGSVAISRDLSLQGGSTLSITDGTMAISGNRETHVTEFSEISVTGGSLSAASDHTVYIGDLTNPGEGKLSIAGDATVSLGALYLGGSASAGVLEISGAETDLTVDGFFANGAADNATLMLHLDGANAVSMIDSAQSYLNFTLSADFLAQEVSTDWFDVINNAFVQNVVWDGGMDTDLSDGEGWEMRYTAPFGGTLQVKYTTPIPEPSSVGLLALGAMLLRWVRRSHRQA